MAYSDNYMAVIRPRPELIQGESGAEILWGWDVTLTDKSDDKTYPFSGPGVHKDADAALTEGATSMIKWMKALDVVKEKAENNSINLDAELPTPEEKPVEEAVVEPDALPDSESTSAASDAAAPAAEGDNG